MKKIISLTLVLVLCLVAKADFTFGEPAKVPNVNSSYGDADACLSMDGLELHLTSDRPGGLSWDLWVATRISRDDDWAQPVNLGSSVNSPAFDHDPCISTDKLSLLFTSDRSGGNGGDDLWITTRRTIDDTWGTPVNLGSAINTTRHDMDPSLSADGRELYFCSLRRGGYGNYDIWTTIRQTSERLPEGYWDIPVNLGPNVNTSYSDHSPSISSDALALFFSSNRPGGYGSRDLWMTTRPTIDDDWGEPANLGPVVNSSAWEDDPEISSDGRWLFFNFDIGSEDLWQVQVIPICDLNDDGIVDSADMCIMVDHWGTDDKLCDIGPMPWGDGIVDVQDLIVLAEHLFEEFPLVGMVE